jgi:hypothetical protein
MEFNLEQTQEGFITVISGGNFAGVEQPGFMVPFFSDDLIKQLADYSPFWGRFAECLCSCIVHARDFLMMNMGR